MLKFHSTKLLFLLNLLIYNLIPSIFFAQTFFTNQAPSLGLNHICKSSELGGGAAFLDYNADGWLDIYVVGGMNQDVLYRNNGDGTFTDVSLSAGLGFSSAVFTVGVTSADINNDGYPELFISTAYGLPSYLLRNNGNGTFSNISNSSGIGAYNDFSYSASFGDYNKDGYLDLYVGNYIDSVGFITDTNNVLIGYSHRCTSNRLFKNNGNLSFTDVTATLGILETGCNLATRFSDYDLDNDLDLINANDFGEWVHPNNLFRNEYPNNSFSDQSTNSRINAEIYAMGIAVGDYDQDQDLDYYMTNIGRNILFKNNGDGTFTDTTTAAGVENKYSLPDSTYAVSWGTGFVDIDNDGLLDLFVANGYLDSHYAPSFQDSDRLYYNNGNGTFTDRTISLGLDNKRASRGFAYGDYDNDGDMDLLVIPIREPFVGDSIPMILFRNELSNNNNWLKVKLRGTLSNRDAIGTKLVIYVGGKSWLHEVSADGSHASQHSLIAHFGLGAATQVDSLRIIWPLGIVETYTQISSNQLLSLTEGMLLENSNLIHDKSFEFSIYPNPSRQEFVISCELKSSSNLELIIFNIFGQVVYKDERTASGAGKEQWFLNSSSINLSEGNYLVQLKCDQEIYTKKLTLYK